MARTPEGRVEDYLVKLCHELELLCLKTAAPGRRGLPDRLILGHDDRGDAVSLHVEVKAPGEVPRPSQVQLITAMREHGAHVVVVDSPQAVQDLLENYFLATPMPIHERSPLDAPLPGRPPTVLTLPGGRITV